MAKKKVSGRGGAREGAGRKVSPDGPSQVMTVSLPQSLVVEFATYAEAQGLTKSAAAAEAIKAYLARKNR